MGCIRRIFISIVFCSLLHTQAEIQRVGSEIPGQGCLRQEIVARFNVHYAVFHRGHDGVEIFGVRGNVREIDVRVFLFLDTHIKEQHQILHPFSAGDAILHDHILRNGTHQGSLFPGEQRFVSQIEGDDLPAFFIPGGKRTERDCHDRQQQGQQQPDHFLPMPHSHISSRVSVDLLRNSSAPPSGAGRFPGRP